MSTTGVAPVERVTRFLRSLGPHRSDSGNPLRAVLPTAVLVMSFFWLTVALGAMIFVLPRSHRAASPPFVAFVVLVFVVFLGHRLFPKQGYHPVPFLGLMAATDAMIALLIYFTGGSMSAFSLLFMAVVIFAAAYLDILPTVIITGFTSACWLFPLLYEPVSLQQARNMGAGVPVFALIALCAVLLMRMAREQKEEKEAMRALWLRAEQGQRELGVLHDASLELEKGFDEDHVDTVLLESASRLVQAERYFVARWACGELRPVGATAAEAESRLRDAATLEMLRHTRHETLPILETIELEGEARMYSVAVPLKACGKPAGVLWGINSAERFNEHDARLLATLATQSDLARERSRLFAETLRDATRREAIFESLQDGLGVIDHDFRLTFANTPFRVFLALGDEDTGQNLIDLFQRHAVYMQDREQILADIRKEVLGQGKTLVRDLQLGAEHKLFVHLTCAPLVESGDVTGAILVATDITHYREIDELKSHFLSVVSHELRTPLTSIRGFAGLLLAERFGPLNERQRHYVDIVSSQAESLTELINSLLDISRIESGMLELQREAVDLHRLAEGVLLQFSDMANQCEVELANDIPEDIAPIFCDRRYMAQVVSNLVGNALKFTAGPGEVRLTAQAVGDRCVLAVADTGSGIPAAELPHIFDRFYQVGTQARSAGTGLGLTIAREFVKAHDGDIRVESRVGEGSTFFVSLPFYEPRGRHRRRPVRPAGVAAPPETSV
ncbi:MAG: sensor histidine kinase [Candidatus Geothermincolia bacterium]